MRPIDIAIFAGYVVLIIFQGLILGKKKQTSTEFHVAGRMMPFLAVGFSIVGTLFSATNFTGVTGEVISNGLYVVFSLPVFLIVLFPVAKIFIPRLRAASFSIYDVIETRHGIKARMAASAMFLFWRLLWMSLILYATAKFLAPVTGLSVPVLVLIAGCITTLYTAVGGMRSVMWTDVTQFSVLVISMIACIITSLSIGGWAKSFEFAANDGLLRPFYPWTPTAFSLDPTVRITLVSALIGTTVAFMARYGADQMVGQRYLSARTEVDAQKGFVFSVICSLTAIVFLALLGIGVNALTPDGPRPDKQSAIVQLVRFVSALPAGIAGLFVAGLFASTMSSVDSGIHSCVTALTTDFVRHKREKDQDRLIPERIMTVVVGLSAMLGTTFFAYGTRSIFESANMIVNGSGGPLLAVMLLALYGRTVNGTGLAVGGLLGMTFGTIFSLFWSPLAIHYYSVVNALVAALLIYFVSLITSPRTAD